MSDYVYSTPLYVYPIDVLPEIEFIELKKCCRGCCNSIVTNPGANCPGLECLLIEWLFKKKGIENGNGQVDRYGNSCRFFGVKLKTAKTILNREAMKCS